VRKVHNLCLFPDYASVEKVQARLEKVGNIRSDGRPILGLDSRYLLEMVLESHDLAELIPAHIWTPWFSLLGSMSGFDSPRECFEDLTPHIHAVETGLSSDPPMNWACSFLDNCTLISNSDAHSPEKLGREANCLNTERSYDGIMAALRSGEGFAGTIEFFPQEGKYHHDGHRKCGIRWDPLETARHGGICPVCGKEVTRGVLYRVAQLADRSVADSMEGRPGFHSITQLPDLLAEALGQKSSKGKSVQSLYARMIEELGPEFHVLLFADLPAIASVAGDLIAEGIGRLRQGQVIIDEGYDGEFGRIRVFDEGERALSGGLFSPGKAEPGLAVRHSSLEFDVAEFRELLASDHSLPDRTASTVRDAGPERRGQGLDRDQERAVACPGPCLGIAGPGSGKTSILAGRVVDLIENRGARPENILAVTFSNKAAREIGERLDLGGARADVMTFHALGLSLLKEYFDRAGREVDFRIIDDEERADILSFLVPGRETGRAATLITSIKEGRLPMNEGGEVFAAYNSRLAAMNAFDLADLILVPVTLLETDHELLERYRARYRHILVDEFQDINAMQYRLLLLLAGAGDCDLFVIGDPDQAIYGFRGADRRFIQGLRHDFPGLEEISLSRSYRCPAGVLRAGGQVLASPATLEGAAGERAIHIEECVSERAEADWIAATIEAIMGGVRSFSRDSGMTDGAPLLNDLGLSDIAVLCRSSFMFAALTEAMANHGIPCQVTENAPLYRREPLAAALKRFKLIYRSRDIDCSDDAEREARKMIGEYRPVNQALAAALQGREAPDEDVRRILDIARDFGENYDDFFRALALRSGVDDYDRRAEAVSLMTIHASKGLEFRAVFIPGCEEGIIPLELFGAGDEEQRLEEERLLYVGMTRTRDLLYLSHAKKRAYRGRILTLKRSSFLDRIEKSLIESGARPDRARGQDEGQMELF
jgi:uncharacterized protein (TIGR00375 family)